MSAIFGVLKYVARAVIQDPVNVVLVLGLVDVAIIGWDIKHLIGI